VGLANDIYAHHDNTSRPNFGSFYFPCMHALHRRQKAPRPPPFPPSLPSSLPPQNIPGPACPPSTQFAMTTSSLLIHTFFLLYAFTGTRGRQPFPPRSTPLPTSSSTTTYTDLRSRAPLPPSLLPLPPRPRQLSFYKRGNDKQRRTHLERGRESTSPAPSKRHIYIFIYLFN